jgi:stage V sporulation protein G
MKISEINIQLFKPANGLVAVTSVVLDGKIYLGSIGVHHRLDGTGYRLTYPTKKTGNRDFHIFHPIERNLGQQIEQAILSKVTTLLEKQNTGDSTIFREDGDAIR